MIIYDTCTEFKLVLHSWEMFTYIAKHRIFIAWGRATWTLTCSMFMCVRVCAVHLCRTSDIDDGRSRALFTRSLFHHWQISQIVSFTSCFHSLLLRPCVTRTTRIHFCFSKNWSEHGHLIAFATVAHTHTCHSSFISSNSEYKIDIFVFPFLCPLVSSPALVHVVISLFRMRLFRTQPLSSLLSLPCDRLSTMGIHGL